MASARQETSMIVCLLPSSGRDSQEPFPTKMIIKVIIKVIFKTRLLLRQRFGRRL
jgi:hypothetical protein